MWREAFQSVADDVERISQEVGERVAQDPLASIGMPRPAKPRSSGRSGKGPGDASGRNEPATTKRRRLEEKEKGEPVAKAAVLGDPFARRRTRPQSYWAVGAGGSSLSEVTNGKKKIYGVCGSCMCWVVLRQMLYDMLELQSGVQFRSLFVHTTNCVR